MTVIAYQRFCYTFYSIYITFQNTTPEKENEIINELKKHPNALICWQCEGKYDLIFGPIVKNVFELNKILREINNKFGDYIRNYDIVTHIGAQHYERTYLIGKKRLQRETYFVTGGEEKFVEIDKIDNKILKELILNSRASVVDIANKLSLTTDIVRYRIKKLKQQGVIQGYSVVLNHKNIGTMHYRMLFKLRNITEEKEKQIFAFTSLSPNIKFCTKCFGPYELTMDGEFNSHEEFRTFLSEFKNKFSDIIQYYDVLRIYSIEKFVTWIV